MKDYIKRLLKDSYDLHVHSKPSHFKRLIDDIDLISIASEYHMGGVMIKNHYESTAGRANLINEHFDFETIAYGGIVLNQTVGGFNPYAVESTLRLGGKMVWMPTRDAKNSLKFGNMEGDFFKRKGLSILNDNGKMRSEIFEIFDICKKYNACLATGHLDINESLILCREAIKNNVKIILTHPDWVRTKIDVEEQIKLAKSGVFLEKVWANLDDGDCNIEEFLGTMKRLNFENIFISTDRGIVNKDSPLDSMIKVIEFLLNNGVNETDIEKMIKTTPKFLVS